MRIAVAIITVKMEFFIKCVLPPNDGDHRPPP
jgi:hypothetical protein